MIDVTAHYWYALISDCTKMTSKEAKTKDCSGGNAGEVVRDGKKHENQENGPNEKHSKDGQGEQNNFPRCKYTVKIFALFVATLISCALWFIMKQVYLVDLAVPVLVFLPFFYITFPRHPDFARPTQHTHFSVFTWIKAKQNHVFWFFYLHFQL